MRLAPFAVLATMASNAIASRRRSLWELPAPTAAIELHGRAHLQVSPRPTDSSTVNIRFRAFDGKRHGLSSSRNGQNTCGWWSAAGIPITCDGGEFGICTNSGAYRGCCLGDGCAKTPIATACYAYGKCDTRISNVVCCQDINLPACVTYLWQTYASPHATFTLFSCDVQANAGQHGLGDDVPSTYTSDTSIPSGVFVSPITGISTTLFPTSASSTSSDSGSTIAPTPTSTLTSIVSLTGIKTPTSTILPNSTTTTSPASTPTIPLADGGSNDNTDNSTPIGAIIGGVIGGAAVLGLLVAGMVFARRRRQQRLATESEQGEHGSADEAAPRHSFVEPPVASPELDTTPSAHIKELEVPPQADAPNTAQDTSLVSPMSPRFPSAVREDNPHQFYSELHGESRAELPG